MGAVLLPVVENALALFIDAEANATEALLPIYQTYTAHERALRDFLEAEKRGEPGSGFLAHYLESLPEM